LPHFIYLIYLLYNYIAAHHDVLLRTAAFYERDTDDSVDKNTCMLKGYRPNASELMQKFSAKAGKIVNKRSFNNWL